MTNSEDKKLILVTNDDGYMAGGIQNLISMLRPMGRVVVVAPEATRSGQSHAVTLGVPLYLRTITQEADYELYACSGSPADCIKIALHEVLDRTPDLVVSGVNHGSNAAVNALYSGTVGASTEGALHGIASVALSLDDHSPNADFTASLHWGKKVVEWVLAEGLKAGISLNVNVPNLPMEHIKGLRVCRMTPGRWIEDFVEHLSGDGRRAFWLRGRFVNYAPDDDRTDEWALANGYVSVVPIGNDMTAHEERESCLPLEML